MGSTLRVRKGSATARELSAMSAAALDVPLAGGEDPELWVHEVTSEATVLGAFERNLDPASGDVARRGSGGPAILVGPGTVHVALLLGYPGALVACEPAKLVNRYVRPLLRALTKVGATAHYFGRDWISVSHRPAGWVGFAHDARSRRALVEAFVAVETPFAVASRASFLGKEPGTLASILGRTLPSARIVEAVVEAYGSAYGRSLEAVPSTPPDALASSASHAVEALDAPWQATCEEVIGTIGAGKDRGGTFRLGGALLASRDAVAEVAERARAIGPSVDELGAMVDAVLRAPGVAIDGVRSLESIRDVLFRALAG